MTKFTCFRCTGLAIASSVLFLVVRSFAPLPPRTTTTTMPSSFSAATIEKKNTVLFIATWGKEASDAMAAATKAATTTTGGGPPSNPDANIQSYLKEPEPVEVRESSTKGTCLVSGFVNAKDKNDQFVFDLLNKEESAFEFSKIVAFVDDVKPARKRLLSRSARYTGLLDKLDFVEAEKETSLPTAEQLEGVDSWVAAVEASGGDNDWISEVKSIASLAGKTESLENVSVLVTNAAGAKASPEDRASIVDALRQTGKPYTILVTGTLEERDEGKTPYRFVDIVNATAAANELLLLPDDAVFSRNEAARMITETLQLKSGIDKALVFDDVRGDDAVVNATETKLIKGLREAGYTRSQEIDHMLRNGTENYQKALDEFDEKYPNWKEGVVVTDAWWESPEFLAELEEDEKNRKERSPFSSLPSSSAKEENEEEKVKAEEGQEEASLI